MKFQTSELFEKDCVRKFGKTELSTKPTRYYNLDVILVVGYRVNSKRGILFRRWANLILKQYLLNGQTINETRCLAHSDNIIKLEVFRNNELSTFNLTPNDTVYFTTIEYYMYEGENYNEFPGHVAYENYIGSIDSINVFYNEKKYQIR